MGAMEVFVPFHVKDLLVLPECLKGIQTYLTPTPTRIVVVGSTLPTRLPATLKRMNVEFLDESTVIPGLSMQNMPRVSANGEDRTASNFQELLKLGLTQVAEGDYFAVVSADCVLMSPTPLRENGKTILYRAGTKRDSPVIEDFALFDKALLLKVIEGLGVAAPWYSIYLKIFRDDPALRHSMTAAYAEIARGEHPDWFISRPWSVAVVSKELIVQHAQNQPILLQRGFNSASYPSHREVAEVNELFREIATMADLSTFRVMLEAGSRDAEVSLVSKRFLPNAKVYAFECNPAAIELCRLNIGARDDVVLVDKAVSDETGTVPFYAIDPNKTLTPHADGNIGASSLFRANPDYPGERYVQEKITVQAIRLDNWARENNITQIDLLWMDLQGAELKALLGLGQLIDRVKFIYTEVEYQPLYLGQPTHVHLHAFLESHGFRLQRKFNTSDWFGNELWVKNDIPPKA